MVGTLKEVKTEQAKFEQEVRIKRIGVLYSRLKRESNINGVKLVYSEGGKIKKVIISPGNWAPVTFKVYVKDLKLFISNKSWGEHEATLLIPNINE